MYTHLSLSYTFDRLGKMQRSLIPNVASVFFFKNGHYVCIFKFQSEIWTEQKTVEIIVRKAETIF